ncbi:MAG: helix-turn-helix domain-containing protein [Bacteroidales bacterium]|nr:helix-turn-helix domain-containing protein [Bacteroidales bacterium]
MTDRIIQVLEYSQLSKSNFAEKIGINPSGLTHILNGRNQPSLDIVKKIVTAFPEINSEWLVMGMGQMLKTEEPAPAVQPKEESAPVLSDLELRQTSLFDAFDEEPAPAEEIVTEPEAEPIAEPVAEEVLVAPAPIKATAPRGRARNAESRPAPERPKRERILNSQGDKKIVKIVFFYDDRSFEEYHPA